MIEFFYYWCCIKWIILKIGKWKKKCFFEYEYEIYRYGFRLFIIYRVMERVI